MDTVNIPDAMRVLDWCVLSYMEEMRDQNYPRNGYAFTLNSFVIDPWVTKDIARAICRSLTDRGYAFYMCGLMSEDGDLIGAGYGITDAGAVYYLELANTMQPCDASDTGQGQLI